MSGDGSRLRAEQILESGRERLDPVLTPLGYRFDRIVTGRGSGGDFAIGRYARGDRAIELHARYGLARVIYEVAGERVDHVDWAAYVDEQSAYPGFSQDPAGGFEHLQTDLTGFCSPLIAGTADEAFRECASVLRHDPRAFRRPFLP